MTQLWLAILLTLVAFSIMNVGMAMFKKGIADAPLPKEARTRWVAALVHSRTAWWGLALNVAGYAIFLIAVSFRAAPISVLRPLAAFGLVVVAMLAADFEQTRAPVSMPHRNKR